MEDGLKEFEWSEFNMTQMEEWDMIVDTRTIYPSDKLTLDIANITRSKMIDYISFYINGELDVEVLLEDSKRNFLDSIYHIYITLDNSSRYKIEIDDIYNFSKPLYI